MYKKGFWGKIQNKVRLTVALFTAAAILLVMLLLSIPYMNSIINSSGDALKTKANDNAEFINSWLGGQSDIMLTMATQISVTNAIGTISDNQKDIFNRVTDANTNLRELQANSELVQDKADISFQSAEGLKDTVNNFS